MNHRAEVCARALVPTLLWIAACSSSKPPQGYGGETHWLSGCGGSDECGAGSCMCGVCTDACDGDFACKKGPRPAKCYSSTSPDLTSRCEKDVLRNVASVCLAACTEDGDCATGTVCLHGACLQDRARVELPPGGKAPSNIDAGIATVATALPSAQDFSQVDAAVDFTEPLSALPPPQTEFYDLPIELTGSWIELGDDGIPCDPTRQNGPNYWGTICMHLDIEMTGSALRGTAHWDHLPSETSALSGPFAPVTDPDVGYPVEMPVDSNAYNNLHTTVANVSYRMYDAVVQNDQLSFWISPIDLWTDWCALQTPYAWTTVQGKLRYHCVPLNADESNTDLGKLALCGSVQEGDGCFDKHGDAFPCVCIGSDGEIDISDPRCASPTCECTAEECHADLRAATIPFSLTIGTSLNGWRGLAFNSEDNLKLVKVRP